MAKHPQSVEEAAQILRRGDICALPTETVYGLGADATNDDAVLKIYEAKNRPRFNPLIVHCATREMAETLVRFDATAQALADAFWPGPLTLVLPLEPDAGVSSIVTAGLDTLAIRMPDHQMARDLIAAVGRPLAAPSANPSGRLSATSAVQVRAGFADAVPVLDGGPCAEGLESTIIAIVSGQAVQLRAGAVAREQIEDVLGHAVATAGEGAAISAPGMLKSHYAPNATLRLDADRPERGEAWLGFGPDPDVQTAAARNLSPSGDLREAARNLFAMLDELDRDGADAIAVARIPSRGLGEAINDRLRRAAAPRG